LTPIAAEVGFKTKKTEYFTKFVDIYSPHPMYNSYKIFRVYVYFHSRGMSVSKVSNSFKVNAISAIL